VLICVFYVWIVKLTWQKQKQGQGGLGKPNYSPHCPPTDLMAIKHKKPPSKGPEWVQVISA